MIFGVSSKVRETVHRDSGSFLANRFKTSLDVLHNSSCSLVFKMTVHNGLPGEGVHSIG